MGGKWRKAKDALGLHLCVLVLGDRNKSPTPNETVSRRSSCSDAALLVAARESTAGPVQSSWCHDIGHEQAAYKPLLKTVFQIMMCLFSHRKKTLLFVIQDKTKTLEVLEPVLREDIKIWDYVPERPAHKHTPLSEFFNVEVTTLSSYEEKEEQFKEKVMLLRERFFNSIAPGGLVGDRRVVVPASSFPFSIEQIWKVIRENRDLDLPAHKVMVANVRCDC